MFATVVANTARHESLHMLRMDSSHMRNIMPDGFTYRFVEMKFVNGKESRSKLCKISLQACRGQWILMIDIDHGGKLTTIMPIHCIIYFPLFTWGATFPRSYIGQYTRLSHGAPTIHRSRESGVRFPDAELILSFVESVEIRLLFLPEAKTGSWVLSWLFDWSFILCCKEPCICENIEWIITFSTCPQFQVNRVFQYCSGLRN